MDVKQMARLGGLARAAKLTPQERAFIAHMGGKASKRSRSRRLSKSLPTRLQRAIGAVIDVIERGAATHPGDPWTAYPPSYHVARAIEHLRLLREGDEPEPHLEHAATRLLMALELTRRPATALLSSSSTERLNPTLK